MEIYSEAQHMLVFSARPPDPPPILMENATQTEAPPTEAPKAEGLSREFVIVITVCSIVVVVGIGVVVIYVISVQHKNIRYESHFVAMFIY